MYSRKDFVEQVYSHQAIIHKICRIYRDTKEDREDLFQEVLYQLWKSFNQFEGKSKITTWMYRIGLNTAMSSFRKPTISPMSLEIAVTLAETVNENDHSEQLHQAIRQLSEPDRALLALYFEDLPHSEIGRVLGITENHVAVRLTRIKKRLKQQLNT